MSRGDYPVTYRVLALKDGLVVKLQFAHGERDELVFTNGEAEQFATALLGTRATREDRTGTIGAGLDDPEPGPRRPCEGFRWIGQSFAHCDRCGAPYWEHTHDERRRKGTGPFADSAVFDLVPITAEDADACRKKWGPR